MRRRRPRRRSHHVAPSSASTRSLAAQAGHFLGQRASELARPQAGKFLRKESVGERIGILPLGILAAVFCSGGYRNDVFFLRRSNENGSER